MHTEHKPGEEKIKKRGELLQNSVICNVGVSIYVSILNATTSATTTTTTTAITTTTTTTTTTIIIIIIIILHLLLILKIIIQQQQIMHNRASDCPHTA